MTKSHKTIENNSISDAFEMGNTVAKLQHEVEVLNQENMWLKEQLYGEMGIELTKQNMAN